MTRDVLALQLEDAVVPALFALPDDPKQWGTVLLINTVRRAFARLAAMHNVSEPDWSAWINSLTDSETIPVSQMLQPETQKGCALLAAHLDLKIHDVSMAYARAFLGELIHGPSFYRSYLEAHSVPSHVLDLLDARILHEELLRRFERLHLRVIKDVEPVLSKRKAS